MRRTVLSIVSVLYLLAPVVCDAEEPYREWLEFFEGTWNIEWDGQWEPFTFRYTNGKYALVGEATTPDGTRALAIYAWDAGKKALVFTWIDSGGNHARQVMTEFAGNRMSGLLHHSGPEFIAAGSSTVVRVGPDKYTVALKYSDAKGVLTETSGVMTRVK